MQQEVRPLMAVEIIEQLHRQFAILSGAHFFVVVNNRAEKTLRKEKEITTDISCHHDVLPMFLLDVLPRFLLKKEAEGRMAPPSSRSQSFRGSNTSQMKTS
nr:uncharacterized protein LOC119618240 isoform X3 [Chlorocebus sabaeus]